MACPAAEPTSTATPRPSLPIVDAASCLGRQVEMQPATDEPDAIEERVSFAFHAIKFAYDDEHEAELTVRRDR